MENKSKKFIRGFEEAKQFMANLRAKKDQNNKKIETLSNSPDQKTKKCRKIINVNFS